MRLARAGLEVLVGSRDGSRARRTAAALNVEADTSTIQGAENREVASSCRWVLLTVPFESAAETVCGLRDHLREGTVFVDVTVPLHFGQGGPSLIALPEGSASQHLRRIVPGHVPMLGCFKTLPAHVLDSLETPLECDTFVFGDDEDAKAAWMAVVRRIPTLRPLDAGGLNAAPLVEGMTALVIRLNRIAKSREGRFRIVGIGS
jgi:NADPH-dependent F420 reductase